VTAIHQLLPTFTHRDAIGQHALELRAVLRELGARSEIYAMEVHPDLAGEAERFDGSVHLDGTAALVYHASTSSPMADILRRRSEPLVVDYHNVTPDRFYVGWDPAQAARLRAARREIAPVVGRAEQIITHSRFSARDLEAWSPIAPTIAPVLGPSSHRGDAVDDTHRAGGPDASTWLFVGRLAPNKQQHRLVEALAVHRRTYGGAAQLHLVGSASPRSYADAIQQLATGAGVGDGVHLHDGLAADDLARLYRRADVFVSASAHEGYCVPLVEAMSFGVPVVARPAGAVAETVTGAAVLVPGGDASSLAAAVHRVLVDATLRARMVQAGRARAREHSLDARDVYRSVFRDRLERCG
jgi:glycosyltransferase involved in cell wall biosynthesis